MLDVGDGIANHILQEDLEDAKCLLVDEPVDMLDSATPSQTSNGRLRNSLDVIPQNLTVPFRSSLSQTLASLMSRKPEEKHTRYSLDETETKLLVLR